MPVKNLTPEQQEAIRQDGICKKTGVRAQWGYSSKEEPKIFYLAEGEKLPKGWTETPAASEEPAEKPEEADKPADPLV